MERLDFTAGFYLRHPISPSALSYNYAVPKKPNPAPRRFAVGDKIKVNMHAGKLVDAIIKAIINSTDGAKYQVDFGKDQTALVHEWQIVKD